METVLYLVQGLLMCVAVGAVLAAPAVRRSPVITTARDKSALASILCGRSGVGKTHFGSTIERVFIIAIEEGLKGCSTEHDPAHFEEADLPQSLTDLLRLIDTFLAANVSPGDGQPRPWRHLVLDSMTGIEKLCCDAAKAHHRVTDMEGKEYRAVWTTAYERMLDVQKRLDAVRRTGVNVWILAHAAEVYEAVAETGATFKRWDLQFRGSEKHVQEIKLLWRGWADQVLFIDWAGTVEKGGKGARAVGRLKGRVLYTRESGTHAAKTRLKLPAVLPATWEDLVRAMRAGVPAPEAKLRAEVEVLLPKLAEYREEVTKALGEAKTANALASILSRAQGIVAMLDDGDDDAPLAPAAEPAPPEPRAPSSASAAFTPDAPPQRDPDPVAPPPAAQTSHLANDDEARARAIVRDATDRAAIAKAFTALNPLKLHPDVRTALRDELLMKRAALTDAASAGGA